MTTHQLACIEQAGPKPDPQGAYYCVYDGSGQRGHVWIADIDAERAKNPEWRYERSRVANQHRE